MKMSESLLLTDFCDILKRNLEMKLSTEKWSKPSLNQLTRPLFTFNWNSDLLDHTRYLVSKVSTVNHPYYLTLTLPHAKCSGICRP